MVLMGVGIIAFFGNLLLDDFRAAWRGGSGMKGTLLASFGIGLAIGMLVFASIGSPQAMALIDELHEDGILVGMAELKWDLADQLRRVGLLDLVGDENDAVLIAQFAKPSQPGVSGHITVQLARLPRTRPNMLWRKGMSAAQSSTPSP